MSAAPRENAAGDVFDRIRAASAQVAARARFVEIDERGLRETADWLAEKLAAAADFDPPQGLDPAHERIGDEQTTVAFIITMNAINFGSGWFPLVRKRPGHSGYRTLAAALRERFEHEGAFSAAELASLDLRQVAQCLEQPLGESAGLDELLTHYTEALCELGSWLERRFAGRFEGPVRAADQHAEALVSLLSEMPAYRDVSRYGALGELEVPFYKRAQITASDLYTAFAGTGPGAFRDHAKLTLFADNLVPHTLRCHGVLRYAPELAAHIDAERLIEHGAPEEVEIRACGLHAVEQLVQRLRARGFSEATASGVDHMLWAHGQSPEIKAKPRHRARTTAY